MNFLVTFLQKKEQSENTLTTLKEYENLIRSLILVSFCVSVFVFRSRFDAR